MKLDDTPTRALSADPAERLVDAVDLPIGRWVMSGDEARLLFCNVPYTRWAGRSSADLVGRTLAELYGTGAWAAARDAFAAAFAGRAVYYERRITHQGAAARWVRVQVFPDRNAQGEVEAVYTIGWDIHNDVLERGSRNLQTFDCGEHGNRRRDHRVAKEHRSADHAEGQKQPTAAA